MVDVTAGGHDAIMQSLFRRNGNSIGTGIYWCILDDLPGVKALGSIELVHKGGK